MAARTEQTHSSLTLDDIRAAAQRIEGAVVRTPTMLSRTLSEATGAIVYVKFENLQFTAAPCPSVCMTLMVGVPVGMTMVTGTPSLAP